MSKFTFDLDKLPKWIPRGVNVLLDKAPQAYSIPARSVGGVGSSPAWRRVLVGTKHCDKLPTLSLKICNSSALKR